MLQVITNASSERHSTEWSHVIKQNHAYWSANTLTWKAGPIEKLTQKHKEHNHNNADADDDDDNNNNNDNSNDDDDINNDDDSNDDNNNSDNDDVITILKLFFVLIIMIIRVGLIDATVWRGEEGNSVFIPFFFEQYTHHTRTI